MSPLTNLAAISTGQAAIWAATIAAVGGIVTAVIKAVGDNWRENQDFQRDLIARLLTREESVIAPLVRAGESQQGAITTIGTGVAELLLAQKIEDGQRRREGSD
jgi:hypothetical protein